MRHLRRSVAVALGCLAAASGVRAQLPPGSAAAALRTGSAIQPDGRLDGAARAANVFQARLTCRLGT